MDKFEFKLSDGLKDVMNCAHKLTLERSGKSITLETILYLVVKRAIEETSVTDGSNFKILIDKLGTKDRSILLSLFKDECYKSIKKHPLPSFASGDSISLSEELERALNRASAAKKMFASPDLGEDFNKIDIDELVASLLCESDNFVVGILDDNYGINRTAMFKTVMDNGFSKIMKDQKSDMPKDFSDMVDDILNRKFGNDDDETPNAEDTDREFEKAGETNSIHGKKVDPSSKTPNLDQYAFNMTDAAKNGKYDPVVGRDSEIIQIQEILCCRKKNNPVLLGDPGCGKTAVVECLAQKIISGDVPHELKGKKIFSLDLNALVSGTQYRGQFEQRVQDLLKELTDPVIGKDIILYVDELHNIMGLGSSSGTGDFANLIKPALSRGELTCIGSTTLSEYRKFIEKDGALKRRFQPVVVDEPKKDETLKILEGLSIKYSEYHRVQYSSEVLQACVDWSGRYVTDRFFPDKAIDVMDLAGSFAKLDNPRDTTEIDNLYSELEKVISDKIKAVQEQEFEQAADCRKKEKDLEAQIQEVEKRDSNSAENMASWPEVTLEHAAKVISKIAKIPIDKIISSDIAKLKVMKTKLESMVIGQDKAVREVVKSLQKDMLGLRNPERPASMLFVGSTGCGKTLIAKKTAEILYGDPKSLVRIDCSEYTDKWSASKLLGSDPGTVGFDSYESPLLAIKRRPRSVLLVDEVDKAAPEVINSLFLPILDDGYTKLSDGTMINFKECLIIFTGNVGTKELIAHGDGLGFGSAKTKESKSKVAESIVMKAIKKDFRPEFINRLSTIIVFNELGSDDMQKIYDLEFDKLKERLEKAGYKLDTSEKVKSKVISEVDTKYGARDLNRKLCEYVEDKVCEAMLEQDTDGKSTIYVDLNDSDSVIVDFK